MLFFIFSFFLMRQYRMISSRIWIRIRDIIFRSVIFFPESETLGLWLPVVLWRTDILSQFSLQRLSVEEKATVAGQMTKKLLARVDLTNSADIVNLLVQQKVFSSIFYHWRSL